MRKPKQSPEAVRKQLNLDETPDAEFMALLEEAMASSEVPVVPSGTIDTTVDELLEICISGSVGRLLARAREQEGKALEAVGAAAGVTRARIQQIENSTNLELATLVKVASALGYRVGIRLEPVDRTRAALVTELPSRVG